MRLVRTLLWQAARVLERVRNGCLYAAVGTMHLDDLRAAISHYWDDFNVDASNIDAGFMSWEQDMVQRFVTPSDSVLIVGCGTGRDLLAFAAMGCRVEGVEPSAPAAAHARELIHARGLESRVIPGYFEDADVASSYDVVVFSYFCFSSIPESRRRTAILAKARSLLKARGRIVVSVLFREKPPAGDSIRVGRMAGSLARSDWRLEAGDLVERGGVAPPAINYEHIFGPGEIEREGAQAGLAIAGRGGHPHEQPYVVFTAAAPPPR
jgi:SAM-dependent methyltransferase